MYPLQKLVIGASLLRLDITLKVGLRDRPRNRNGVRIVWAHNAQASLPGPVQMKPGSCSKKEGAPHVVDWYIENHNILWLSRPNCTKRERKIEDRGKGYYWPKPGRYAPRSRMHDAGYGH
jgi:hypothetical protein